MLNPQQRARLQTARDDVANATTPHQKRRASNVFREVFAEVADELGVDELITAMSDPIAAELTAAECDATIEHLDGL